MLRAFKDTMEGVIKMTAEQLFELIDKAYTNENEDYSNSAMLDMWLNSRNNNFIFYSGRINQLFRTLDKELLIGDLSSFDIYDYGVGQPMFFLSGIRDDTIFCGTGDYYDVRM